MAKEKTPRANVTPNAARTGSINAEKDEMPAGGQAELKKPGSSASASASGKKGSGKKSNRSQIGGTAVTGAKSTQPKPVSTSSNPQQQEIDGYNRTMRRRMQNIGAGPYAGESHKTKTPQERRKEKIERIKQRRAEQASMVKRSLPGGKLKTDTSPAVRMVIVVAVAIVLLIAIFVVLRLIGVMK